MRRSGHSTAVIPDRCWVFRSQVKDEHDLAGEPTSLGTGASVAPAERDAEIAQILRQAGAIPIGKTTLPELGMHPFTESVTWGVTRNPWDLSRTPGGSSGGSAAAVAAGLVPFATAGDGGGSIRIPASCCNLFGMKVQRGRVTTRERQSIGSTRTSRTRDATRNPTTGPVWPSGQPRFH